MKKVALIYDFDKTLSPKDMQEFSFIPSLGIDNPADFWKEVNTLAQNSRMDNILAYLYVMLNKAGYMGQSIRKEDFIALGEKVGLYPGVKEWFDRINEYGKTQGLQVEHYIISCGLAEILEGTSIRDEFKRIYACKFHYNASGVADWPAAVVNFTTKTQYLFRINKGILDENNELDLNRYTPMENREIPFERMIYIGDGYTDVPCMKLVSVNGGQSIAVYGEGKKSVAEALVQEHRANFIAKADYRANQQLDITVKRILDTMGATVKMQQRSPRLEVK